MSQPWIHKAKTDSIFILAPSFLVLVLVLVFHNKFTQIEAKYPFYIWLFLIVFIDVAHVYATLFKTYFVKSEFQKRKKLYLSLPVFCFFIGLLLFQFGSIVFWSALAYIAVFHFIRQQYGFMKLYSRNEQNKYKYLDTIVIYTATIYPMLFWFLSPKRNFNWFVENEFFRIQAPKTLQFLTYLYVAILFLYLLKTIKIYLQTNYFNLPKNAIISGTTLSWYFGIVFFNNDLIFTLLNVVSHGIPYISLIYLNEITKKSNQQLGLLYFFKNFKGLLLFLTILLFIAFSEEFLWEILVWNEHITSPNLHFQSWQFLIVPLLTVPQFTHYLLDGFIWKREKNSLIQF